MEQNYEILNKYYGYQDFRNGQLEIIDSMEKGYDTIVIMATGGGKSLCFQIPSLLKEGLALVISPLIALMDDQVAYLKERNIRAACIHSNIENYLIEDILNNIKKYKFLYLSPERLNNPLFLRKIKDVKLAYIIIDEAHCIFTWGHDFRPAYYQIKDFIEKKDRVPIACFSATASQKTIADICQSLKLEEPHIFNYKKRRDNLFYSVIKTNNKFKNLLLYLAKKRNEKTIIYTLTIKETLILKEKLSKYRFSCLTYYSELEQKQKKEVYQNFLGGDSNILISTSSFGMGVNIPDIRNVILYQIPLSLSDLEQQFGRAGRDGNQSSCLFLFDIKDAKVCEYLIKTSTTSKQNERERYKELEEVIKFGLTKKCLHSYLDTYFDQKNEYKCQNCSNCKKQKKSNYLQLE